MLQGNEDKGEWDRTNPMVSCRWRMTDKMNKPWRYYTKQNKSDRKWQILCGATSYEVSRAGNS